MEFATPRASPSALSPFSSPNAGALLRMRVFAWSQETGLPPSVRVSVDSKIYVLHKSALVLKSGYLKQRLLNSLDVELPESFPGGSEAFEKVAFFIYGSPLSFDPFGITALRCAAEFLDMTEDYATGNLCERSDLYLNQVVLQSWDDTLIVLQKCQSLLPWSEELLIVSRCIESLAFMACMEILDPEQRRDRPILTLQALAQQPWSCEAVKEIAGQELWIKDLIALPFEFFKRIIGSLRRQGMREKHISPVIVFYANKWVLSKKAHQFWKSSVAAGDANHKVSVILTGIIQLLPLKERASKAIPSGFYFTLLSRSLRLGLSTDVRIKLQNHIASLLHLARFEDFLLPEDCKGPVSISSSVELETMERIISIYLSGDKEGGCMEECTPSNRSFVVAELWDRYLSQVAVDPTLTLEKFVDLVELIPMSDRESHDHLYRAVNTFLLKHPVLSTEEKSSVCKFLNCRKLSQEICIEAVQNELMPLRLIVQALFAQQLNTHQAFKDCSDSFRYMNCGELSRSLSSSRHQLPKSQPLGESPYEQVAEEGQTIGQSLGLLIRKDLAVKRSELAKAEYESASFRIQSLERKLESLKRNLQWQSMSKESDHIAAENQNQGISGFDGRAITGKRNRLGQSSSCVSTMRWASQRKCASRLLKVFRRLSMFGRGKSKRKQQAASGLSTGSIPCRNNHLE